MSYDGASWSVIGGPGRQFVVNDIALYGITPDGGAVVQYTGTPGIWSPIGGPATRLIAGGDQLYAIEPGTGNISRYEGSPFVWTFVGGPGEQFVANRTGLFAITPPGPRGEAVMSFSADTGAWTEIAPCCHGPRQLIAGGDDLFVFQEGVIARYDPAGRLWYIVGGPGRSFTANNIGLYASSPDQTAVYKLAFGSNNWTRVGGATTALFAGGNTVVAWHASGDIMMLINP